MTSSPDNGLRVSLLLGTLFGLAGMGSAAASLALAPMAAAYDIGVGTAAWSISLYALMLGVGTAIYGRVADLQGPRVPMLVGLGLMSGGAFLAAVAPNFGVHLLGRLLQGAGAAAVPTLGAAIITHRYVAEVKTTALLRVAGVAAAVTAFGPLAGGFLVDVAHWRLAFALPIAGLLVIPFLWPALHVGGTGARLDLVGAALTASTAAGLVLLLQSPATGVVVAVIGLALLVLGVPSVWWWVRRRPDGFLPLRVISNQAVVRSAIASAAIPAGWFALLIAIPLVLLDVGWEPIEVGLVLVPSGLVGLVMPRLVGPLMARISAAQALSVACLISAIGLVISAAGAHWESPLALVGSVLFVAVAFGIGQPALNYSVGEAVDQQVRGVALGVATLVFMVGGSIGSATVGGLGEAIGIGRSIAVLTALPVLGLWLLAPLRSRTAAE